MFTDHQQMFDIVASNNDELALAVEVEGIDGPGAAVWPFDYVATKPRPNERRKIMDIMPTAPRNGIVAAARAKLLLAKKLPNQASIVLAH